MLARRIARILLAIFFFAAGVMHFLADDAFAKIVPPPVPMKVEIVWATGVMELCFAAALLVGRRLRDVGRALSLYLLAVLPANIYMALAEISFGGRDLGPVILWTRVALQFPLIALVHWACRGKDPGADDLENSPGR